MTNKGARLSRAQTVATRTHFVSPAGKRFAHHLIMEIQIQRKPQTRILTRIRMLKHHARLLCTTITTRQRMSKHIIITTRLRTHPAHLPMRRQWLLPNIFLPHSRTSLLETTIFPIIRNTDLILQTHLPKKIRRKSLRQVRNKRNQLWSPTVPAAAPSKAPLLLSSSPPPPLNSPPTAPTAYLTRSPSLLHLAPQTACRIILTWRSASTRLRLQLLRANQSIHQSINNHNSTLNQSFFNWPLVNIDLTIYHVANESCLVINQSTSMFQSININQPITIEKIDGLTIHLMVYW